MNKEPEIIDIEDVINKSFKNYKPIITSICCLISILLFIGFNVEHKTDSWELYSRWGAPSSLDILSGKYWGLITTNFLHFHPKQVSELDPQNDWAKKNMKILPDANP